MRQPLPKLVAFMLSCSLLGAAKPEGSPDVTATVDRESALYKVGEKAVFTITVAHKDGAPVQNEVTVHINLTNDGGNALLDRKVIEAGEKSENVEYTFKAPGFVRLTAIGRSWKGQRVYIKSIAVAACEPEKIRPVVTMPEDFDAFWKKGRERLAQIPLDLKQERIDHLCDERQNTYKVSFANVNDTRIYGYLLVPKTGKRKYPAFVSVAPAGVGKPREDFVGGRMNNISRDEAICLYMGVFDHDLGHPKEYYKGYKSKDGGMKVATGDKEKYFLYRATLGIDRAITWLAARDDVDATHLVYLGNSQGGGMGLVLTGLNKKTTAACVNIPALCDHLGFRGGRSPGWPGVLDWRARRKMTEQEIGAAAENLRYFDAVNFARRITVPVLLTMGFVDTTCPPSGVYAAYNVITAPKQILSNPHSGHAITAKAQSVIAPWVRQHLGLAGSEAAGGKLVAEPGQ